MTFIKWTYFTWEDKPCIVRSCPLAQKNNLDAYEDTIAYDFFEGKDVEAPLMPLRYTPQELAFYKLQGIPLPLLSSFTKVNGVYFQDAAKRNIVSEAVYNASLN